MPVFGESYYRDGIRLSPQGQQDCDAYRRDLASALEQCATHSDQQRLLRTEAIEITRHVTDGIRDMVLTNKRWTLWRNARCQS
jgi:hypothetical protein